MFRRWQCGRLRASLVDLAENRLDDAPRAELERHLDGCADCRDALAALREVPPALHADAPPALGEAAWHRQRAAIMRQIRAQSPPTRARPPRRVPAWAPALAAAATAVLLAVVSLRPTAPVHEIDALDDHALMSLAEVAGVFPPATGGLELESAASAEPHSAHDLSDDELTGLAELLGDV